ncbi:MAG: hypothetical protein M3Y27_32130 [Acidobacteriota bacterium]|nr:hypothetical protein [Acidobacteriota bacterium]
MAGVPAAPEVLVDKAVVETVSAAAVAQVPQALLALQGNQGHQGPAGNPEGGRPEMASIIVQDFAHAMPW